jgi:hypothetical protein
MTDTSNFCLIQVCVRHLIEEQTVNARGTLMTLLPFEAIKEGFLESEALRTRRKECL